MAQERMIFVDSVLKGMDRRMTERRKHLRLTQEEVAERADLTEQTISTAGKGWKALRPENIIRVPELPGLTAL